MLYVYILQSHLTKDYYIGQTEDIETRINQHYTDFYSKSYTSKITDWELFYVIECESITQAIKIESHIKRMKSRKFLESIQKYPEITYRLLAIYTD